MIDQKPLLTIAMADAVMDALRSDWTCPAGYIHKGGSWCCHPLPPEVRERIHQEAGLRKRIRP